MISFERPSSKADIFLPLSIRIAAVCIVAVVVSAISSGCQSKTSPMDTMTPDSSAKALVGTDMVASVNGEPISVADFYSAMQHYIPSRINGFPQNPMLAQSAGRTALQDLIQNKVMIQSAKTYGVPVQQSDVDAMYTDNKMLQEAQSTATFEQTLAQQGYSPQEYESEVLEPQAAQLNLLTRSITVTPAELQANYASNKKNYTLPNRVHIHRVMAGTKLAADSIFQSLKSGKTMNDFGNQMDGTNNPADPTDVPQWINVDTPSPVLGTAAALLKTATVGQILPPAQVQGQWWVIQVIDRKPSQELPFSQVQDIVKLNILRQKIGPNAGTQFGSLMADQFQKSVILIKPPQYQSLVAQLKSPVQQTPPASQIGAPPAGGLRRPQ